MKNFAAALVIAILSTSPVLATNWGSNDTENKNLEGIVLLTYINGDYKNAGTILEKLNIFKSKYKTLQHIKNDLEFRYESNNDQSITTGADYENLMDDHREVIAAADSDGDGNLNQEELDVLEAIAEEVSNSKGSTLGCDAVSALGDKVSVLSIPPVNPAVLIPFWKKCVGL